MDNVQPRNAHLSQRGGGWEGKGKGKGASRWSLTVPWWLLILVIAAPAARARDTWLEADLVGTVQRTEEKLLHLRAGTGFKPEEELPLQKERVERFDLLADRTRRQDLLATAKEGQIPVAKLPVEPGASLVVMTRREKSETLDAASFNRFLTEEGQEAVLAARARANQTGAEGRETITRCLKTLLPGADPASALPNTLYKRSVGQKLEILLENNPGRLPANHWLAVKVLFDGKPLAGAKVFAYRRDAAGGAGAASPPAGAPAPGNGTVGPVGGGPGTETLTAVTSAQGLVEFKLDQSGFWLVQVVHVRAGAGADKKPGTEPVWESFWGAYTFHVRNASPAAPVPPAPGAPRE